jgi:hypothetical protein
MAAYKSPTPSKSHKELLQIVKEYREEAETARRTRLAKNQRNWDIYMGNIDWSHKTEGQSTEHLPKMANSAEQMTAFIRRALTQFGPWFSCELPRNAILSPEQARALLMRFLDRVVVSRNETANFATILGDAVKQALMESLIIFKVHGCYQTEHSFRVEPGDPIAGLQDSLQKEEHSVWRLRIDLVSSHDFFPDPTGRGLYRIHRVERDWLDVWNMAQGDNAIYDKKIVERIYDEMEADESKRLKARHRGQDEANGPRRRKRLVVEEVWGTLLGTDGRPLHEQVVMAVANERHVIREPEPISDIFWHGEDPFVVAPVVRVPHSQWHKALYDNVAPLNLALDELFNLILDGAISSVWGVRQVREHWLADPRQVSNGIPQGATLIVNEEAPIDGKVVEQVTEGEVPPEALATFNIVDREQLQASMSNDTRLGNLPQRQVKATELVQAEQNSSVLLDGFTGDLERGVIVKVLEKSWLCTMQYADDIPAREVVDAVGVSAAFKLSRMSDAERYAMFATGMKFKATGLSGTLARAREFQKLMAMNQGVATNPLLLQAYLQRFSGDKMLTHIMRSLNINPEDLQMSEDEIAAAEQTKNEVMQLSQVTGGGTPSGPGQGGGDGMTASRSEINQDAAPTSGVG